MDKLEAMQVYVCVVDTYSFTRAAEVLACRAQRYREWLKNWNSLKIQLSCNAITRKLSVTAEGGVTKSAKEC